MGIPKYKNLYKGKETNKTSKEKDKEIVDTLTKTIATKIKDPEMAKKAAQIISSLINKK